MCLTKAERVTPPTQEVVTGYKVFRRTEEPTSFLPDVYCEPTFRVGDWHKDQGRKIIRSAGGNYPKGFHAFATRRGAEDWREGEWLSGYALAKVEARRVVARGKQGRYRAFVAREMRIVEIL